MNLDRNHGGMPPEPAECHLHDGDEVEISHHFAARGKVQVWTRARRNGPRMLHVKGQLDLLVEARDMARARIAENAQLRDANLLPQRKAMPKQSKAASPSDTPADTSATSQAFSGKRGGPVHAIPGTVRRVSWQDSQPSEAAPKPMGTVHLPLLLLPEEEEAVVTAEQQEWLLNEMSTASQNKVRKSPLDLRPPPGLEDCAAKQFPQTPGKIELETIVFNLHAAEPQQAQPNPPLSSTSAGSSASSLDAAASVLMTPNEMLLIPSLPLSPCSPCTPSLQCSPCSPCSTNEDGEPSSKISYAKGICVTLTRTIPQPQMT